MILITNETKMYCPHCGEVMNEEDADIIVHPATWGYYGGSPEEREIKCPRCGEELEVVDCFCKACGAPLVRDYDGYYESSGTLCPECEEIITRRLKTFIEETAEELDVENDKAIEAIIDCVEDNDWFR
jgi:uncharacterized Zn finger protein (UPF0148 family)